MKRGLYMIIYSVFFLASLSVQAASPSSQPATKPVIAVGFPKTVEMNVTSYNILRAEEKAKVLSNIRSSKPDLVLLQEVPERVVREYGRALKMKYNFGPYYANGDSGFAILTKDKIRPVKLFSMKGERNYALAAEVTIKGETIFVVCVHLKSLPRPISTGVFQVMKPHTQQAGQILTEVKKQDRPALVGGDCNSLSLSPEYGRFTSYLKDCAATPAAASQPTIFVHDIGYRIDYLFTRGPWFVQKYGVNPNAGSDHRMIHCRLKLQCR